MTERGVTKSVVEQAALAWLESIRWAVRNGAEIATGVLAKVPGGPPVSPSLRPAEWHSGT